jgi:hypothetical protein
MEMDLGQKVPKFISIRATNPTCLDRPSLVTQPSSVTTLSVKKNHRLAV